VQQLISTERSTNFVCRFRLLWRIYLESPAITDDAIELLKAQCCNEVSAPTCITLLQHLVTKRPPKQLIFLNCLLLYTAHESSLVSEFL
jgi:hypothetical protein